MDVISIDPGSRYTGIATRMNNVYATVELTDYVVAWNLVRLGHWELVLCENFTAVEISKYGLTTVRIIGGIQALCLDHNIPFKTQQNVRRIKYKERAKQFIIKQNGKMIRDHQQDALAHLYCWEAEVERG